MSNSRRPKSKLNIAIITKSASTNSGARFPFELAPHLAKYNKVTVFANKTGAQKGLKKILRKNKVDLFFYSNPIALYQQLKKSDFNIISFHGTLPSLVATKLTLIPIIKTYYGTQFDAYLEKFIPSEKISFFNKFINKFFNCLIWIDQKIQLSFTNQVIAISKYTQRELIDIYDKKSKVIYLGIGFNNQKTKSAVKSKHQSVILSVSRITPYKGFHTLIETLKKLRLEGVKVKLIIVGKVEKTKYLSYLKRIMNKNDQILTNLNDKELFSLYKNCDLYATCDRYLFFGLPIVEAASLTKPTVALNFAAAGELIISGKTGYVANNLNDFHKYLKILITNPTQRKKLGLAAFQNAWKNFNIEKTAKEYNNFFLNTMLKGTINK